MTTHNVEGIVLKTIPYKENDLLVYVYTLEYGKMTLLARGARKITSKNAASVTPLTLSEFEIIPKKGISQLIKGVGKNYYSYIKQHLEEEIVADYLLEYFYRYIEENNPQQEIYDMLKQTLDVLENKASYWIVYALINSFMMKQNGINIEVDGCVKCGETHVTSFSIEEGGFLCHEHDISKQRYSLSCLKAIRHLYKASITDIKQLDLKEEDVKKVISLFEYYVEEYAGIKLKSKLFVKQIMKNT